MSEARLGVATRELQEAQEKLDDKEAELRKVQDLYDAAMAEKQVSHTCPLISVIQACLCQWRTHPGTLCQENT